MNVSNTLATWFVQTLQTSANAAAVSKRSALAPSCEQRRAYIVSCRIRYVTWRKVEKSDPRSTSGFESTPKFDCVPAATGPSFAHVCHVWSTVCELVGEFLAHKMPNDGHNDEHHASNVGFGAGNKLIIMSKNVKMNDEQLNDAWNEEEICAEPGHKRDRMTDETTTRRRGN